MANRAAVRPRRPARIGALLLAVLGLLGGCQTMDNQELAWQALHAVDVAQTLNAAGDPCYREEAWLTKRLIGEQPNDAEVVAWGVATAVVHAWVSYNLEEHGAPRWLQKVWDLGTLGHTTYAIISNHDAGVRPFGDNRPVAGCYAG
ncbi:MAG: hypothetical protein RIE74_16610 [Pseudomonadales bacterium]